MTDDQRQIRIREEADTVEEILRFIASGKAEWICSEALLIEISRNPTIERRRAAQALLPLVAETVSLNAAVISRARELELAGFPAADALHLSCAESGRADVLLTTDDRFVSRAKRRLGAPRITVLNPVIWWREILP